MKRLSKIFVVLVMFVALCAGMAITVSAHACTVEELGGTYLLWSYSDGTIMKGAKIIVKDADGNTLGTSKTDKQGIYNYAEYADTAAKIMINDGEGHALEYEVPAEIPPVTDRTPVEESEAPTAEAPATEEAPAEVTAPAPAPAPEKAGSSMSGGTIAAVVIVVAAAVIIAVLFSKRGKNK